MKRLAVLICLLATAAAAAGPDASLRPQSRPVAEAAAPVAAAAIEMAVPETAKGGFFKSLRPVFRVPRIATIRTAQPQRQSQPPVAGPAAGSVCGDPSIQGKVIGDVKGAISGCGVENAVSVTSVSGVRLSMSSTMDCSTAQALKSWVDSSARPALAGKGGGLRKLQVAAHYTCRRRNNAKTGKISEHGTGRAIDISGFELADGSAISVLQGWNARTSSKVLRRMHAEACGPFGTVLGPKANRFHLDHFHFDTANHRSGSYCR
jgi:hypothetical protein